MGKKHKKGLTAILIIIAVVIVLGAAAAVYFLAFDSMTIVSDSAFSQIVPQKTVTMLRLRCALKGIRLSVTRLTDDCFYSEAAFEARLGRIRSDYVLLGPLSAAYAVKNYIDVSDLLKSSIVLAIHDSEGSHLFDCTLLPSRDNV